MQRGVLLVVDPDPSVHRAMAAILGSFAGDRRAFDVVACTTAHGGLNACCALEPECVLAELALPDRDAVWLAASVRAQPSPVSQVPFIVASALDDEATRVRALRGGADAFVGKPIATVEVAAQIRALVAMTERLREASERPSVLPEAVGRQAIVGDLDRMNVATVLSALELEQRSGDLRLRAPHTNGAHLVLSMAGGVLVGGWMGSQPLSPIRALREALHWQGRRFEWIPSEERRVQSEAGTSAGSIGALVLEALRLDEMDAAEAAHVASHAKQRSVSPPPLPRMEPPPRPREARPTARSGTRPKVTPTPAAPGHRLVETVLPGRRPDPRAEPGASTDWMDDATTLKMRVI